MIKNIAKKSLLVALLAGIGFGATAVQAQERVYVIDQRDVVALSGFGLCWRTGYWTPAAAAKDPAGCQCDKDLLPKEVCEPKPAAAAKSAKAAPVRQLKWEEMVPAGWDPAARLRNRGDLSRIQDGDPKADALLRVLEQAGLATK